MTHSPDHAERAGVVAAGLTKAQRDALAWKGTNIGCVASNAQLADRLIGKGLAIKTGGYNSGLMLDWTPLGLAVRAALNDGMLTKATIRGIPNR